MALEDARSDLDAHKQPLLVLQDNVVTSRHFGPS
jgi:hypothetical protein